MLVHSVWCITSPVEWRPLSHLTVPSSSRLPGSVQYSQCTCTSKNVHVHLLTIKLYTEEWGDAITMYDCILLPSCTFIHNTYTYTYTCILTVVQVHVGPEKGAAVGVHQEGHWNGQCYWIHCEYSNSLAPWVSQGQG